MTTTLGQTGRRSGIRQNTMRYEGVRPRTVSVSLGMVGVITVLISAWGGIIPYLGPTFGYSADGSSAWQWSLTHTVLALIPGAIGVVIGFSLFTPVRTSGVGLRRFGLGLAGIVAIAAGAWFVVGPLAWPVISSVNHYFVPATPLRNLANQVGYSVGPGLILAACGAFAIGWAARHSQPLAAAGTTEEVVASDAGAAPMAAEPVGAVPATPASPVYSQPPAAAPASNVPEAGGGPVAP
jgi:hypothetical protein